jgi:hypothetical protein
VQGEWRVRNVIMSEEWKLWRLHGTSSTSALLLAAYRHRSSASDVVPSQKISNRRPWSLRTLSIKRERRNNKAKEQERERDKEQ